MLFVNIWFQNIFPCMCLIGVIVNGSKEKIKLENNGYSGIVVAINPEVSEDTQLIEKLKKIWTDASTVLWKATKNRAYFADITILLPKDWTNNTYPNATTESYSKADVIVANSNPVHGNVPYTLQYGMCGEPGEYIHLTPDYIKNDSYVDDYGPKGKSLVHEWAHLRWGVFDEASSDGYDSFYWDGNQKIQATRCPIGLEGEYMIADSCVSSSWSKCTVDSTTGFPEEGCVFIPYCRQPGFNVSIMSHQFLDNVVTFCHDDESDPMNLHNKEAPNEQNRLCNYRSVWDVITSSFDFDGRNSPNPKNFKTPNFAVIKAQSTYKSVLVLDTSGSMTDSNKLEDMVTAADLFIKQYAPSGSKLGIVEFESSANILSNLTIIDSKKSRNELASHLPEGASGETCIGCGISKAIEVLEKDGTTSGSHIIVITDGSDSINDTKKEVYDKGIVIDAIFFGEYLDNFDLQALSEDTGGRWFFNKEEDLPALISSFQQLGNINDGNVIEKQLQINGKQINMKASSFAAGYTDVDSTIGNNTAFTFTWSQYDAPIVTLYDPDENKYCSVNDSSCIGGADVDITNKTIIFLIGGVAMSGKWRYNISNPLNDPQTISLTVTSMASDPEVKPIVVEAGILFTNLSPVPPIVVYAKVTKRYEPVLGADVEAIVSSATGEETKLTLLDTGSTPDVREMDGIYSRYFTEYTAQGRYSITVNVVGEGNETDVPKFSLFKPRRSRATFNPGVVLDDGIVVANPNIDENGKEVTSVGVKSSELDPFSRVISPGGFYYSGPPSTSVVDVLPPSKVLNLQASQLDIKDVNNGIVLTFAAPGSDFDSGTAAFYEMRYTFDGASVLSNSFESGKKVTADMVSGSNLNQPKIAGEKETFTVKLVDIPKGKDTINVWFAVRAHDDATPSNMAPVSNVAMASVFYAIPALTPDVDTTTANPTLTCETPKDFENFELYRILTITFGCTTFALLCALISTIVLHCKLKKADKKMYTNVIDSVKSAWEKSDRDSIQSNSKRRKVPNKWDF